MTIILIYNMEMRGKGTKEREVFLGMQEGSGDGRGNTGEAAGGGGWGGEELWEDST